MRAAETVAALPGCRYPIRGIFPGCCASAGWMEARRKTVSNQSSFLFMTVDVFTAMDMTQTRANENHIFTAEKPASVAVRLQGLSNLIRTSLQLCLDAFTADVE